MDCSTRTSSSARTIEWSIPGFSSWNGLPLQGRRSSSLISEAASRGTLTLGGGRLLLFRMSLQDLLLRIFAPLVCISCASAPSVVLRSPVDSQCAQAGLDDCDQIAEGVMLYVDGREAEALPKLRAGAAGNSPQQLSKFIALLRTLEREPQTAKYSASILGVVATLNREASRNAKRGIHAKSHLRSGGMHHARPRGEHPPIRSISADTDPAQLRDGLEVSPTETLGWCTQVFGDGSRCATIAQGPLYLTDAVPNGRECQGQFLAVMSGDALAARFESPLSIHGGRIFVPSGSSLIFGQFPEPTPELPPVRAEPKIPSPSPSSSTSPEPASSQPPPKNVILDDASPEWSCLLYWSGFVPYGSRRR